MSEISLAGITKKYNIYQDQIIDIAMQYKIDIYAINDVPRVLRKRTDYGYKAIKFFDVSENLGIIDKHLKLLKYHKEIKIKIVNFEIVGSAEVTTYLHPPAIYNLDNLYIHKDDMKYFSDFKVNKSSKEKSKKKTEGKYSMSNLLKVIALQNKLLKKGELCKTQNVIADKIRDHPEAPERLSDVTLKIIFADANAALKEDQ